MGNKGSAPEKSPEGSPLNSPRSSADVEEVVEEEEVLTHEMTTVMFEGDKRFKLIAGDQVKLKIKETTPDAEDTSVRDFHFTIGAHMVVEGFNAGVHGMNFGMKCVLKILPEGSYPPGKIRDKTKDNKEMDYEVEVCAVKRKWPKAPRLPPKDGETAPPEPKREGASWKTFSEDVMNEELRILKVLEFEADDDNDGPTADTGEYGKLKKMMNRMWSSKKEEAPKKEYDDEGEDADEEARDREKRNILFCEWGETVRVAVAVNTTKKKPLPSASTVQAVTASRDSAGMQNDSTKSTGFNPRT